MRLSCRYIFYIIVLLRFHTICLYAKLIMFSLLIIFIFIVFRFNHGIIQPIYLLFLIKINRLDPTMLTGKEIWTLLLLLKGINMCLLNYVLTFHH